jgi:hypothetical protein
LKLARHVVAAAVGRRRARIGQRAMGPSQSSPWRKIRSITSCCRRSMKLMTSIAPPHSGHSSGSTSKTRLINIAHVEGEPARGPAETGLAALMTEWSIGRASPAPDLARSPRRRGEYQP